MDVLSYLGTNDSFCFDFVVESSFWISLVFDSFGFSFWKALYRSDPVPSITTAAQNIHSHIHIFLILSIVPSNDDVLMGNMMILERR